MDTHRLASLIIEIFQQRAVVFQFQQPKNVVIDVNRDLHQTHELPRHCARRFETATKFNPLYASNNNNKQLVTCRNIAMCQLMQ